MNQKAYVVTDPKHDPKLKIVKAARSPGHAMSQVLCSAREAGLKANFTDFRARRAPAWDGLAAQMDDNQDDTLYWEDGQDHFGFMPPGATL